MVDRVVLRGAGVEQISLPGVTPAPRHRLSTRPPVDLRRDGERRQTQRLAHGHLPQKLIRIRTFGGIFVAGEPARSVPSLSGRQRHLLRWLVLASWGPPLEVTAVCDSMWPAADGAAAASNFASAVRRLRRILGEPGAVVVDAGTVALHPGYCRCDLDVLHQTGEGTHSDAAIGRAATMARNLVASFEGENPVLLARPDNDDMARRIGAVGIAWRQLTLRLAHLLQGSTHALLVLRLCERIERHGLADERILSQWQRIASEMRPGPAEPGGV